MKIFSSLFSSVKSAPGRLARMVFTQAGSVRMFLQPRSGVDFASQVGDGTGSSTVMAPIQWAARTLPEAPVALMKTDKDGREEQVRDHPFLRLMRRPNPYYSGPVLWQATYIDRLVDGNAYWLKVRDRGGHVVEYWWAPSWTIKPVGDESTFITHYEYKPGNEAVPLANDDVIHFRFGLDSDDPRKGRAPLKSVLREIYTDDEAANFTASLLRNMGIPGLLVSPEKGSPAPNEEEVKATKAYLKANFTGDKRGEPLVMKGATRVEQFGFSPEQLLLRDLRRIPEERVSAVTGIPAVVAGLGAGLDRSTFNNFAEARVAAYEQALIPDQTLFAEDLWFQALTDFEDPDDIWLWKVFFDLSRVRCLQEDYRNTAYATSSIMKAGMITRSEARQKMGYKPSADDDVFYVPMNTAIVPTDGGEPTILTAPKGSSSNNSPE